MFSLDSFSQSIFRSIWIALVSYFLFRFYRYVRERQSYWQRLGVPGPKPIFLLGTELELAFKSWSDIAMERMLNYGKLSGGYAFLKPVLYVLEPELIKTVLMKDFHCFMNRGQMRLQHEILNQNLVFAPDTKWKRMRTIISPSFATGKLRKMNTMMNQCLDRLFGCIDRIIDQNQGIIEGKKLMAGLTIDVIAKTGFGTETNANDPKSSEESAFIKYGLRLFDASPFRMILSLVLPIPILKWLNIKTLGPPEPFDYFINMTNEIIRQRKSNPANKRTDLLQFMLEAEVDAKRLADDYREFQTLTASMDEDKSESTDDPVNSKSSSTMKKLTETEVIANSIFFLITGFETTASSISHCLFLLAWHSDIQERLHRELKTQLNGLDVNSDEYFDRVMSATKIPYFEAVVKETLRLYPALALIGRRLNVDDYKLGSIPLKRDQMVQIPVYAVHHCEDYYPDPFRFDPERFMPDNKDKLIPYTFLPFGLGPRNCIGMRFAYQEIKLSLARLLIHYRFVATVNTPRKLTFKPRSPFLSSCPFELKVIKR